MHTGRIRGLEVTWGRALRIWWGLAWRSVFYGLAAGLALRLAQPFAYEYLGMLSLDSMTGIALSCLVGVVVSLFVSLFIMKRILRKQYAEFSIFLVDHADVDENNPHAPWHGPVGRRSV